MLRRKNLLIIISLLFIFLIEIPTSNNTITNRINNKSIQKEYSRLIINKININNPLYDINSPDNQVDKNITILKESITPEHDDSLMIIAAHSGSGDIAYFDRLDELVINDEIILIYNSKKYYYLVKNIWEEKKTGYININKESKKQLVLTTCSPTNNNYQLIVNCTEKESN